MDEARDYIRAMGGGLLIGLPLLFTQEVWQHAVLLPAWKILLLLGLAAIVVIGYNAINGFRADATIGEVVVDSVEAMGIGTIVAFVALLALGRIDGGSSVRDIVGHVALESIPIAFGASLSRAQLSGAGDDEGREEDRRGGQTKSESEAGRLGPFQRLLVAAGGALLFALNVAPTEEPVFIGVGASPVMLLGVMALSLVVTLALVFFAEFGGRRHVSQGILDRPIPETIAAYVISLLVAWTLLWSFGRVDGASVVAITGMVVSLGLVASLGAAVGRLLVASGGEREDG
ncbi:MAG: TIGR02587 family membrane protein [Chloroflexi bacterium]|nr:TIGR02587 family membrane protein [Chloroflexota bacterium]